MVSPFELIQFPHISKTYMIFYNTFLVFLFLRLKMVQKQKLDRLSLGKKTKSTYIDQIFTSFDSSSNFTFMQDLFCLTTKQSEPYFGLDMPINCIWPNRLSFPCNNPSASWPLARSLTIFNGCLHPQNRQCYSKGYSNGVLTYNHDAS